MAKYRLAIDIGASSGRHIISWCENGKLICEEMHRFPNGAKMKDGMLCWDSEYLFTQVIEGMKKCREAGKIPCSVGIDTWAVDYVLLDAVGERLSEAVSYRDQRTGSVDEQIYKLITEEELYIATGIQKQPFNTIYQLMSEKLNRPELLDKAQNMLMIPDWLHYRLSGVIACEYTNATTTQLVSPETGDWAWDLIDQMGYPRRIFPQIVPAGTNIGRLLPEIAECVGFDCDVIVPATHDTGSAVLGAPYAQDSIYISSGTWSLLGVEVDEAVCSKASYAGNFTNEGGYAGKIRLLKNIMGLWMIQCVRHELEDKYSFAQLCDMAQEASIDSIVDCNDGRFLAPESMIAEIREYCRETGQQIPDGAGETARVVYRSLAQCYKNAAEEIESITGRKYKRINIVGGGANADYLSRMTAEITGRSVAAGPTEATAIGNITAQMLCGGDIESVADARRLIASSFTIRKF